MKAVILSLFFLAIFSACEKGYEARVVNYYNESMDTVVVGESGALFTNVTLKQVTSYLPVKQGKHRLQFITHSKKRIYGNFEVPSTGSGRYTIQIDGIQQISILEDESQ